MAKTAERKPLTFDPDDAGSSATEEETTRPPRTRAKPKEEPRQQLGARVKTAAYRKLKVRAAMQGVTVAALVEQAIDEFLANHPD
jgi:hypothetical protein